MTKEKAVEQLVDLGMTKDEAIKEVNDICNTGIDIEHQIDFITRTTKIRPAMFIDGSDGPCYIPQGRLGPYPEADKDRSR